MAQQTNIAQHETILAVPFEERFEVKNAAGRLPDGRLSIHYDKEVKLWKAYPGADLSNLTRWVPDEAKLHQEGESDPRDEYAGVLDAAGFVLDGLPVMDGNKHRVKTLEDKTNQKSGIYVGYLDGRPAGWYRDYRNQDKPVNWKATGVSMDPVAAAHARALAAQKKAERDANQVRKHQHHAHRSRQLHELLPDATDQHPYLMRKGVPAAPGVKVDRRRDRLVVPLLDENGEIQSLQRIDGNGVKRLKKGAKKHGHFFVVGGQLNNCDPILYAEGYSTAASIHQATGRPVVMTVDGGNMPVVAETLAGKYPDSPQIMLGDDDRDNKTNTGRVNATKAADIVGGKAAFPEFDNPQGHTDFNDLHHAQGIDEVKRQVGQVVSSVIQDKQKTEHLMSQEDSQPIVNTETANTKDGESSYFITDDSHVFLSRDGSWGEKDKALEISDPEEVLRKAAEVRQLHSERLVDSDLYIYRSQDGELDSRPVLRMGNLAHGVDRVSLANQWKNNMSKDLPFPEEVLGQSKEAVVDAIQDSDIQHAAAPNKVVPDKSKISILAYNRRLLNETNNPDLPLEKREKSYQRLLDRSDLDENQTRYVDTKDGKVLIGLSPLDIEKNRSEERAIIDRAKDYQKATPLDSLASDNSSSTKDNDDYDAYAGDVSKQSQQPSLDAGLGVDNDIDRMGEIVEERIKQVDPLVTKKFQEDDKGKWRWRENPDVVAFREKNNRVTTKSKSPMVASAMVALAESRGWTAFKAKGSEEFRRSVWLEGNLRGLDVHGYTPSEKDKETLDSRLNQIERVPAVKEHVAKSGNLPEYKDSPRGDVSGSAATSGSDQGWSLLSHGKAPYQNDPENSESYYVELERGGKIKTIWGVGLASAINEAGATNGDKVILERTGQKAVSVPVDVKDSSGNVVGSEALETKRNAWDVTVVEKSASASNTASVIDRSENDSPNNANQRALDDYKNLDKADVVSKHPEMNDLYGVVASAKIFASANIPNEDSRRRFVESVESKALDELADKGAINVARVVKHKTTEKQYEHNHSR